MALVRVPANCGGMTLASAGVVVAASNIITVPSALEATALVSPYAFPGGLPLQSSALVGGATTLLLPTVITNITINATGYAVVNGVSAPVPAADAAAFILGLKQRESAFELVSA